jgi:hypothetical protein
MKLLMIKNSKILLTNIIKYQEKYKFAIVFPSLSKHKLFWSSFKPLVLIQIEKDQFLAVVPFRKFLSIFLGIGSKPSGII